MLRGVKTSQEESRGVKRSHGFKRIQKECKIKGIKRDSHGELSEVMRSHDESKGVKRSQLESIRVQSSKEELSGVKRS